MGDGANGGSELELLLLGPFEVRARGMPVPLSGAKAPALLADLALSLGRVVSSDRLVEDLWGEAAPGTAAHAVLEAHVDSVRPGEKVAVVDDLLATGGTAWGAAQLVHKQEGQVGAFLFVVELSFLKGRDRLAQSGGPVEALISY